MPNMEHVLIWQATSGEVVKICLSEMERCQYFVCFLGARYGFRPNRDQITKDTFERFDFLNSVLSELDPVLYSLTFRLF